MESIKGFLRESRTVFIGEGKLCRKRKFNIYYCEICKCEYERESHSASRSVSFKCNKCSKIGIGSKGYKSKIHHKEYRMWQDMKKRCYNPKVNGYSSYGARGISVCDDWRNSFENFYLWLKENGFNNGYSIDRKNVDGNYEPNNCRLIPLKDQYYNLRTTLWIPLFGKYFSLAQILNNMGKINYRSRFHDQVKYKNRSYDETMIKYGLKEQIESYVLSNMDRLYTKT